VRVNAGYYKPTYSRPELRKEGEALYASIHSGQTSAKRTNHAVSSDGRRSVSTHTTTQQVSESASSGTTRRVTGTVTGNARTNNNATQGTFNDRRSSATVNEQRTAAPVPRQSTEASRRTGTSAGPAGRSSSTGTTSGTGNSADQRTGSKGETATRNTSRR